MYPMPVEGVLRRRETARVQPCVALTLSLAILIAGSVACGPIEAAAEPPSLGLQRQTLEDENGLAPNGLSANGLSANGFVAWFAENPAASCATTALP